MSAAKKKVTAGGVDDFLNHSTRSGGGAYLAGWKDDGKIQIWLPTQGFHAPAWVHPVPHVVEKEDDGDKKLAVWSQRWICHESEEILKRQNFFDKSNGDREAPPEICPNCIVLMAVRDLYREGKIGWTDPAFVWKGDDEGDETVIRAGGMDGSFNGKDLSREKLKELRKAGVRRDHAFKQDLRAKLKYLIVVADNGDIEAGLQKTWESSTLGNKLKKAIRDEIKRARCKEDPEGLKGNPGINPYPFEWTFDDDADFENKFDVLALTKEVPTDKLLALLKGPAVDLSRDVEPGNCFTLRVELEEHCVLPKGMLDFDKCFAAAEKAGLMTPPEESKEDQEDDIEEGDEKPRGGGRTPEVRGKEAAAPAKAATVTIGTSSPAWTTDTWKPGANVKGADVILDVPDGVSDERFAAVRKACKDAGALSTAEAVVCTHCREVMTTQDAECPSCGSKYDDDGKLLSRPCLAPECPGQVPLEGEGPKFICEKCGTIHLYAGDESKTWTAEPKAAVKPAEDPPRRGRRTEAAEPKPEPKPAEEGKKEGDTRKRGVPFDQPEDKTEKRSTRK